MPSHVEQYNSASNPKGQNHDKTDTTHDNLDPIDARVIPSRLPHSLSKRVHLSKDEFFDLDKEQLYIHWRQQSTYIDTLETTLDDSNRRTEQLKTSLDNFEQRGKRKLHDATRRENNLKMKLVFKDKKIQDLHAQLAQVVQSQLPTAHQLEATLIDPAINLMFEKMKSEVELAKNRAEEMQNELSAWKFTPDSNTGKRLMAKCRLLHNENEELGKDISSGWVAQLTGNLALQKKFSEEMKKSQSELDEFLLELEEEVEGMQNTIYYLQQQLREAREERRQGCSTSENVSSPPSLAENVTANVRNNTVREELSEPRDKRSDQGGKPIESGTNKNEISMPS